MGKKVVVISTSLRAGSNSDALAKEFIKGAQDAGNSVEYISLRGKKISYCLGCFACQKIGHCVINDDAVEIEQKILTADVVVFASPIYYYEMSGQMKTLIDRLNPLFPKDYSFRDVYFLTTSDDPSDDTQKYALGGLSGWLKCMKKATLKGTINCGGIEDEGAIKGNPKLIEAYNMGKNC